MAILSCLLALLSLIVTVRAVMKYDVMTGLLLVTVLGTAVFQAVIFVIYSESSDNNWFDEYKWTLPRLIFMTDVCALTFTLVRFLFCLRLTFGILHARAYIESANLNR